MDQDLDLCSAYLCFGTSKPGDMVWSIGVHSSGSLDVMAMMRPESRSAKMWIWTWICAVYVYFLGPQNLDVQYVCVLGSQNLETNIVSQ